MPASNSFGNLFRITTFGESHGSAIGVLIDGIPSGIDVDHDLIQKSMEERQGAHIPFSTPRKEEDHVQILSGIFENKTTGAPILLLIANQNQRPSDYKNLQTLFRPGHASFTYLKKYGIFDPRGGGRASGRETAARVAAGAFAKMFLAGYNITITAFIDQVGPLRLPFDRSLTSYDIAHLTSLKKSLPIPTIDETFAQNVLSHLEKVRQEGDSCGGSLTCLTSPLPVGLGEPVYQKLPAMIGSAILSIPACKGIEFGEGFDLCTKAGSYSNDSFITPTNHAGGTLGGISNGHPLVFRSAFKPTSTIQKEQTTLSFDGSPITFKGEGRHDLAIILRTPPIVEAMTAIVLADAILMDRTVRKNPCAF